MTVAGQPFHWSFYMTFWITWTESLLKYTEECMVRWMTRYWGDLWMLSVTR